MKEKEMLKKIYWRDLRKLTFKETFIENSLTVPWLAMSLILAFWEYYLFALPFSFFFFLTALRQVHNGFHNSLGTNKFFTEVSLFLNSILMLTSIHAVKFNHLRHHKYCLTDEDFEGRSAKMNWFEAVLYGPRHIVLLHKTAYRLGSAKVRRNVTLELSAVLAFVLTAFYFKTNFLIYHIVVMFLGELLTAFFAVWTVHHDTDENPQMARTQRSLWKNRLTFNMFFHLEHHLFPAVPTIKLPELARRLDKIWPDLDKKKTF